MSTPVEKSRRNPSQAPPRTNVTTTHRAGASILLIHSAHAGIIHTTNPENMLTSPSKFLLTAVSAMLLPASAAMAGCADSRIHHPNGGSTFLPKSQSRVSTLGLYVNEHGVGSDAAVNSKRPETPSARINLGRGQYLEVRTRN